MNHFNNQEEVLLSQDMLTHVLDQVESLKKPDVAWQPTDFLPDFNAVEWEEDIRELQRQTQNVSDDIYMVLVGNCITEEALPTYMSWLNKHEKLCDETGIDAHPWARWTRYWTAEENKHGDLLNKYLHFSGRVDMRSMEVTINHLLQNGFDTKTERNPYMGMVYTSFQERATRISHQRTGLFAMKSGDEKLKSICSIIAADEGKHETVYQSFVQKFFDYDPDEMMVSLKNVLESGITMPSVEMGPDLFRYFTYIAEKTGIYTFNDYIDIMRFLITKWKVESIICTNEAAQRAQEYICRLPDRLEKLSRRKRVQKNEYNERSHLWLSSVN